MINTIKIGTSEHSIVPVLGATLFEGSSGNPLRLTLSSTAGGADDYGLTIAVGSGITTGSGGLYVDAQPPLFADQYGLQLKLSNSFPGLKTDYDGLRVMTGSGLTVDAYGIDILLVNPNGALTKKGGLSLVIGSDIYSDGATSHHRSLTDNYGLRLKLSKYTATPNGDRVYIGNAITPTEYGLSLKVGEGLLVEQDALDVKLSFVTQLSGGRQKPNNAITVIPGEGAGAPGLTLKLQERVINGSSQTLLTTINGGLDIDIDALKTVLGLS